jgi:hypothetical protein
MRLAPNLISLDIGRTRADGYGLNEPLKVATNLKYLRVTGYYSNEKLVTGY